MRFVIFPTSEGWQVTVRKSHPGEGSDLEGPFPTSGAARRAVREVQKMLRAGTIELADEEPPEDEDDG